LGRPRTMPEEHRARIRRMRKAGASLPAIAATLNDEGIPTAAGGKRWYASTVRAALLSA
jgi:Recombinase